MGWGSGQAKRAILDVAAGPVLSFEDDYNPYDGKFVLIDVSGLAHKASKKQPKQVVREGKSTQQQQYVTRRIEAVVGEGGTPVLVMDGRAYPPKEQTRRQRRTGRDESRRTAETLEGQPGKASEAESAWKEAAAPQEPFWRWLMQYCIDRGVPFVVAPYEADAQLVSLQEDLGGQSRAVIWAASQDSDLVIFGGSEVIYDWDITKRTFRAVRLEEHLLGRKVGAHDFTGWIPHPQLVPLGAGVGRRVRRVHRAQVT
jgi:exonuclease 1